MWADIVLVALHDMPWWCAQAGLQPPTFMDKEDMMRYGGCTDEGATFLAMVRWGDGGAGVTHALPSQLSFKPRLLIMKCCVVVMTQVEDAVAAHPQAHTFVGTGLSSVTESITYERIGLGNDRNWFLEKDDC
jgi:hypothetical protein